MKVVATSDFHGWMPEIPECDILLICGDITPVWNHDRKFQAAWLKGTFRPWLEAQPAKHIVGIGGNHDFIFEQSQHHREWLKDHWTYLDAEDVTIEGLKIWGSPMTPRFGNWAFMAQDQYLESLWREIPRDIDILLTHGPSKGYGDLVPEKYGMGRIDLHVGSATLREQLDSDVWENLKLHAFGHIHEGYGEYTNGKGYRVLNVSHVNEEYAPVNPPVLVNLG